MSQRQRLRMSCSRHPALIRGNLYASAFFLCPLFPELTSDPSFPPSKNWMSIQRHWNSKRIGALPKGLPKQHM